MAVRQVKASASPARPAPAAIHAAVKKLPAPVVRKAVITAPTTVTHVTLSPMVVLGLGVLAFYFLSKKA